MSTISLVCWRCEVRVVANHKELTRLLEGGRGYILNDRRDRRLLHHVSCESLEAMVPGAYRKLFFEDQKRLKSGLTRSSGLTTGQIAVAAAESAARIRETRPLPNERAVLNMSCRNSNYGRRWRPFGNAADWSDLTEHEVRCLTRVRHTGAR